MASAMLVAGPPTAIFSSARALSGSREISAMPPMNMSVMRGTGMPHRWLTRLWPKLMEKDAEKENHRAREPHDEIEGL